MYLRGHLVWDHVKGKVEKAKPGCYDMTMKGAQKKCKICIDDKIYIFFSFRERARHQFGYILIKYLSNGRQEKIPPHFYFSSSIIEGYELS